MMLKEKIQLQIAELKYTLQEYTSDQFLKTSSQRKSINIIIKASVININFHINELTKNTDQILSDGINKDFNLQIFFESLKDKSTFNEINPRTEYDENQQNIEWKKKLTKNALEMLENEGKQEQIETDSSGLEVSSKNYREIIKSMYYNGPENRELIMRIIDDGFNISDSIFPISRMIERGRTIGFIQFLIENGLKLTITDIKYLKEKKYLYSEELLKVIYSSDKIDPILVNHIIESKK